MLPPQNQSVSNGIYAEAGNSEGLATVQMMESASPLTRVLLVDDDEDEYLITRDLLRECERKFARQFSLEWCRSYSEGAERVLRGDYDVCLLDYRLGVRSGLDLLREAVAGGCDKPLILLTGQGDPVVDAAAMQAGAADYVVKDAVDAAYLERTIRYAIVQKRIEQQLRSAAEQNARLMAAVQSASMGIVLTEGRAHDGGISFVNAAFTEMTGYVFEDIAGQSMDVLGGAETSPAALGHIRECVAAGRPCEVTLLNYRKDGVAFWNDLRISPIYDAQQNIVGHVGFLRDVTEKINADRALRESRRSLENAQRLTHLGSWQMELSPGRALRDCPLFWSAEIFRILGLEPGQCVPSRQLWFEFIVPEDRAVVTHQFEKFLAEKGVYDIEYRVRHTSGDLRNLHVRAELELGADGVPLRVVGTAQDITERKRAQDASQLLAQQLQSVMDAVPVVLWSLDMEGRFTFSQGRALESVGLKPGQAVGQSIFELYSGAEDVARLAKRALSGETFHETIEVNDFVFDVHYAPMRDAAGQQIGVVGVSYDVTEQARAQRELDETQARWARMVPNLPGMVYRLERAPDKKLTFTSVSEGSRELFGIEPESLMADSSLIFRMLMTEQVGRVYETIEVSAENLSPWNEEVLLVRPDGQVRWIRGQSRPYQREDGTVVWDGILIDLTQERRAREELSIHRRALDEAQRLAHLGSFRWNLVTGEVVWSDEMYRIFGFEPGEFTPTYDSILGFIHPVDRDEVARRSAQAITKNESANMTMRIVRRDGTMRTLETRSRVETQSEGKPIQLVGSAQDITERVEAEAALRESEERYALAARGANDGLWDWNLQSGDIYFSPRWKQMIGFKDADIGNNPQEWFRRVHPDDLPRVQIEINAHLTREGSRNRLELAPEIVEAEAEEMTQFEVEYRLQHRDGSYRWMLARGLAICDASGTIYRIAGSQTDVTDRKRFEEDLARNAFYDTLTNLPNRALFLDRLENTIKRAKRNAEHRFAVLFLDLDRFKKINDSLGHLSGDQLLVQAAARFESCLRPDDTVARLGGDEFAVLLDGLHASEDVERVANRIQKELEKPFDLEGREVFVTVSIGIAAASGNSNPEELLRNADTAMYRAKGQGRARFEVFDASMHQRAVRLLELETDLWRALDRHELCLHYQPIISLEDGQIRGFEALVRWNHPARGLVSPGEFIPLAEETGLIVPIGWWVLKEAARQAKIWNEALGRPLFMSVNLSSKQFSQLNLIENVREALENTGLEPHLLKLEITESVIMENTESASTMLHQMKELGIELSMDDFGTGYSSLSYLHRFPLDTLKIDRSFVSQMKEEKSSGELVGTIVSMANGLAMTVVAEGVETPEQLAGLRGLGCGYAQGFFFSRPLAPEKIEEFVAGNPTW